MELTYPMPKRRDDQALSLRIPKEWHEDLRTRAFHERRPIAELIREALKQTFGYTEPEEGVEEEGRKGGVVYRQGGIPAALIADQA